MERTITVDGKTITLRATALVPRLYRHLIGRDMIQDMATLRKAYAAAEKAKKAGADEEESRRVCWLIAHHHSYGAGEDTDFRILLEADFLVNADEDGLPRESILAARERLFRTGSGRALLDDIFLAKPYII